MPGLRWTRSFPLLGLLGFAPLAAEASQPTGSAPADLKSFTPLSVSDAPPEALITLGRMLYYEGRLSPKDQSSCNSCHPLSQYGAASAPSPSGPGGKQRGATSVSAYHGAAQVVPGRPGVTRHNPLAKEIKPQQAVASLKAIQGYVPYFQRAFPGAGEAITFEQIVAALDAFRHGLVRPGAWDDYLRGKDSALSQEQMEGAKLFNKLGCIECHTGEYVGGLIVERSRAGGIRKSKLLPKKMAKGKLKVPSLRNVEQTAPYFQDGSAATVEDAIRIMGQSQLGIELEAPEVTLIAGWLKSLTSAVPPEYIARPTLPGELPAVVE